MMNYQLAQLNIAQFRLPKNDPVNRYFVDSLDHVYSVAAAQPGFIWRLVESEIDSPVLDAYEADSIAVNLSVWSDLKALVNFVYRHDSHTSIMRRRKEWFEKVEFHMVLWWVEENRRPTIEEAKIRLELLKQNGPTYSAFTFKQPFSAPADIHLDPFQDECA